MADYFCTFCGCRHEPLDHRNSASADTHPKDGDVEQAPLVSGAVPKADAHD